MKISIEICIISARGVKPSSPTLWKRQWYAVGWIHPNNKYRTKFDASTNTNPVWKTKFSVQIDNSKPNFHDLELNVEVYSRDPFFLTEKLHGSATVLLKEFLAEGLRQGNEEIGSYQLRKKKSCTPNGFVDVSVRVFEDKEELNSRTGNEGGIQLSENGNKGRNEQSYHQQMDPSSFQGPHKQPQTNVPYSHPMTYPTNYFDPYVGRPNYPSAAGPSYQPLRTPPPPPPSNFGYVPNFHPTNDGLAPSYFNMPSSSGTAPRQRGPPGFAMGAGAGALAAGAVMFGDNFMSGFDDPSLTIATDVLF